METTTASQQQTYSISVGTEEILDALTEGFTLSMDPTLWQRLREIARISNSRSFAVKPLHSQSWLELGPRTGLTIHRSAPSGFFVLNLDRATDEDPSLRELLAAAERRTNARVEAKRLLSPVINAGEFPTREQFVLLRTWSPLLERLTYHRAVTLADVLDDMRHQFRDRSTVEPKEHLIAYWAGVHAMSHMVLLSSELGAQAWLSEIATQLPWEHWSPTMSLLRERTMWLAACSARVARAFGDRVVEPYLDKLAATNHPMAAFDALFGLTAIGLSRPSSARSILREITAIRQATAANRPESVHIEQAFADAANCLESRANHRAMHSEATTELGWQTSATSGLATGQALRADPTQVRKGGLVGFSTLPKILRTPLDHYYPLAKRKKRQLELTATMLDEITTRAWRSWDGNLDLPLR